MLKKFKFLRGTPLDPFGYTAERKNRAAADRRVLAKFCWPRSSNDLTPDNHRAAVALASLPEKIRGFGPVKQRHLAAAKAEEAALREQFRAGSAPFLKAAE